MVKSALDDRLDARGAHGETAAGEDPLSEESEKEILEMVEDQLDRPNPPDTKVLYRRAMYFIDRNVRRLSLQQFNAKFPLQVKRRRARDRNGASSGSAATGRGGDGTDGRSAEESVPRSRSDRTRTRDATMAVDRNPDVMEMVERALRENPDVSNSDLKLKAEEIDEDIADLSARQFNARYPLQVKRKLSEEDGGASGSDEEKGGGSGEEERGGTASATASAAESGDDGGSDSGSGSAASGTEEREGDVRDRIMDLVRRLLRKEEEVSTDEMQERAAEIDPGVRELSTRQFHARYPLQVKRKLSAMKSKMEEKRGDGRPGAAGSNGAEAQREVVREALLDFARAVAGAEDRGKMIDALTSVDEYVDRVVQEM